MSKSVFGFPTSSMPKGGRLQLRRGLQSHERWAETLMSADATAGQIEPETNRRPLLILGGVMVASLMLLSVRLFALQISGGERNLGLADGNRIRQKLARAPRGVIYDRNQAVLVRNQASFDLVVIPALLPPQPEERQKVYLGVATMTGLSVAEVSAKAETKGLRQAQPQLVVSGLDRDKALLIDQSPNNLAGFSLDVNPIRDYQDAGQLSQILGYSGRISEKELLASPNYLPTDYLGKLGIEKEYEDVLRGQSGSEQAEVDASGRPIKLLASRPSVAGSNLVLAIDKELENHFTAALAAQLEKSGSKRASGVALDPRTGEILAVVNLPSYDNNLFSRGISQADYARLLADPAQPLFNKAINGSYPSGSTIKPVVAAAALEEKVVTPSTTIVDEGKLEVINQYNSAIKYVFNGWEHSGLGVMNIYKAIAMSSDIYFYTVGGGFGSIGGLGINRLTSYYHRFGFGKATGVDLPDETAGRVPTPEWKQKTTGETWYTGDTYNISVGQGDILVSPLQLAVATAAIANGGDLIKPHLVKRVQDDQGALIREYTPEVVKHNLVSASNLAVVRQAMRQTVTEGTACCMVDKQVPVAVAGKTGTAETDPGSNRKPHSWFTSFAPFDSPKIVMVALVENSGEGAEYAVPAVRETLAWYFGSPRP